MQFWNCVKEQNRIFALPNTINSFKISAYFFIKIDRSKMDRNVPMTIPELGLLDFFGFEEVRQCKIYLCNRVKLESLTMSSQEQPKNKSKRNNGLFCLHSECTCVDVMYFVPVCTIAYHLEKHKTYNGYEP